MVMESPGRLAMTHSHRALQTPKKILLFGNAGAVPKNEKKRWPAGILKQVLGQSMGQSVRTYLPGLLGTEVFKRYPDVCCCKTQIELSSGTTGPLLLLGAQPVHERSACPFLIHLIFCSVPTCTLQCMAAEMWSNISVSSCR